MVERSPSVFPTQFAMFTPIIEKTFLKNRTKIIAFLEEHKTIAAYQLNTQIYSLKTVIDYPTLYARVLQINTNV